MKSFSCQSFVPAPESNEESTELMPTGTYSTRYLILPDGTTVTDCGFLPIVVEKEWQNWFTTHLLQKRGMLIQCFKLQVKGIYCKLY